MSTINTTTSQGRPGSPTDGDMYYETDTKKLVMWDSAGNTWRAFSSSGATLPLMGGTHDIHYDGGLWEDPAANYALSGTTGNGMGGGGVAPVMHFDANLIDMMSTSSHADGAAVLSWSDRSNNMWDMEQPTVGSAPIFEKHQGAGPRLSNIYGQNMLLSSSAPSTDYTLPGGNLAEWTCVWVAKAREEAFPSPPTSSAAGYGGSLCPFTPSAVPGYLGALYQFRGGINMGAHQERILGDSNTGSAGAIAGWGATDWTDSPFRHLNDFVMAFGVDSNAQLFYYINGGSDLNASPLITKMGGPAVTIQGLFNVGSGEYGYQYTYELMFFETKLSLSDMNTLRGYFGTKYPTITTTTFV